jgi:hypothetical protein
VLDRKRRRLSVMTPWMILLAASGCSAVTERGPVDGSVRGDGASADAADAIAPAPDAGLDTGTDGAAADGADAAPPPECAGSLPPLPEDIEPPCSVETRDCVDVCRADHRCVAGCLNRDATPARVVSGYPVAVDCSLCWLAQAVSCLEMNCPAEVAAYRCCSEEHDCPSADECPECVAEASRLSACGPSECRGSTTGGLFARCYPRR